MSSENFNGVQLTVVCATFLCITYTSVVLRCFVRAHMMKSFQLDDWLMLIALVSAILFCFPLSWLFSVHLPLSIFFLYILSLARSIFEWKIYFANSIERLFSQYHALLFSWAYITALENTMILYLCTIKSKL